MFQDEVKIKVIAGKGGDGCTSFRREKFVEMGGPNGGNGGKGASIIFKTDPGLRTLIDLHMMKQIKGDKGTNGKGSNRNGAKLIFYYFIIFKWVSSFTSAHIKYMSNYLSTHSMS